MLEDRRGERARKARFEPEALSNPLPLSDLENPGAAFPGNLRAFVPLPVWAKCPALYHFALSGRVNLKTSSVKVQQHSGIQWKAEVKGMSVRIKI
ncbi:MAG: hypothetical protein ICV60_04925 [Pyrinomonadaceae bacterium]|nr:hypothetical protein [Pyrinomonadaceae bacterium]